MEEKLRKLMKHEGLNSTRLAEMLGIQASGISHIMSGRNKPSYDFIVKLLQSFPQLNPDWLLRDKGPMYRDEVKSKNPTSAAASVSETQWSTSASAPVIGEEAGLFSQPQPPPQQQQANNRPLAQSERDDEDIIPAHPARNPVVSAASMAGDLAQSSSIERIVVFYKDKTFSEYQPI